MTAGGRKARACVFYMSFIVLFAVQKGVDECTYSAYSTSDTADESHFSFPHGAPFGASIHFQSLEVVMEGPRESKVSTLQGIHTLVSTPGLPSAAIEWKPEFFGCGSACGEKQGARCPESELEAVDLLNA